MIWTAWPVFANCIDSLDTDKVIDIVITSMKPLVLTSQGGDFYNVDDRESSSKIKIKNELDIDEYENENPSIKEYI